LRSDNNAQNTIDKQIKQVINSGGIVYITSDAINPETLTIRYSGKSEFDFANLLEEYENLWTETVTDTGDEVYILKTVSN